MNLLATTYQEMAMLKFFFKDHKLEMAFVLFLMVASGLLESLNLAALYPIINYGLKAESSIDSLAFLDTFVRFFGQEDLFLSSCLFLIVISVVASAARLAYHFSSNRLIHRVIEKNQREIFERYLHADYRYFVDNQQGRLIYAGTVAPIGISSGILIALRILNSAVASLFFIILLSILAWQGMLFVAVFGGLYIMFIRQLLKRVVNRNATMAVEEDNKVNVVLNEFITGIKTVKAFHQGRTWQEKYVDAVHQSVWSKFKVNFGRTLPDSFLKFIFFISFALIAIALNAQTGGNILPLIPMLGTFAGVLTRLIPYANLVGGDIVGLARLMPDIKIIYDTLTQNIPEINDGISPVSGYQKEIAFRDVTFRYPAMDVNLLENVNLTIPKGKMTAIVGSSGSGKSTLVSLLLKFYQVNDGVIEIDGVNINDLTLESYLSLIGFVSQETFIFNGTIEENIRFGLKDASIDQIKEAARLANAHEFIEETPDGYRSLVGDAGVKLSGGQRQRIAIARAMLRKPQIMILDEATSSLDNIAEKAVQQAIVTISKQTTVLIIAHRLSTVKEADKIIVLEKGRIVEEGTHDQLLRLGKAYQELYAT